MRITRVIPSRSFALASDCPVIQEIVINYLASRAIRIDLDEYGPRNSYLFWNGKALVSIPALTINEPVYFLEAFIGQFYKGEEVFTLGDYSAVVVDGGNAIEVEGQKISFDAIEELYLFMKEYGK